MSDISENFYIAGRLRDLKYVVAESVLDECMQCHDTVVIDPKMLSLVKDMRGIICVPCVEERTGKTLMELFEMNQENIMKIFIERFGDAADNDR